jgi:hypothetical protein
MCRADSARQRSSHANDASRRIDSSASRRSTARRSASSTRCSARNFRLDGARKFLADAEHELRVAVVADRIRVVRVDRQIANAADQSRIRQLRRGHRCFARGARLRVEARQQRLLSYRERRRLVHVEDGAG